MTVDPSVFEMAGTVVALVGPYLAGKVAEGAAAEAGKKAFEWLNNKLTSAGAREVLEEIEKNPEDEINREALEVEIKKALRRNEAFREGLAELLKEAGTTQSMTLTGDGNKGVQIANSSNVTVDID